MRMLSSLVFSLFTVTSARKLEMVAYAIGAGSMNLGGGSTSSSTGMKYRIDGGDWEIIKSEGDKAFCSAVCDTEDKKVWYSIPGVDEWATACIYNLDGGQCVPGSSFDCYFTLGNDGDGALGVGDFSSTEHSDFIGIADEVGTYCGGVVSLGA